MASTRLMQLAAVFLATACSQSPVDPPDGPVGSFRVTTTTAGPGAAPTLLQLLVDDDPPVIIDANGSHLFENVTVGELVARVIIPGHCSADHHAPRTVEIEEDEITELSWSVRCPLPVAPGIATNRSDGTDDFVPWVFNMDGSNGRPIGNLAALATSGSVLNPARTRLAYADASGLDLAISDVDGGATVTTNSGRVLSVDWSPDGQWLLVARDGTSADGGTLLVMWPDGTIERTIRQTPVQGARWAPDGRRIAYREGAYIFVEDLHTSTRINTGHILVGGAGEPAWSPDGTELAFLDAHAQSIRVMNADGTNLRTVASYTSLVAWSGLDWGTNGLLLMAKNIPPSNWGTLHVVPSGGGELVPLNLDGAHQDTPRWAP